MEYDLSECEEVTPTILRGVKKGGQRISVVIRPSDNGKVIIYYPSERNYLDHAFTTELWVEDGQSDPQQLTLGKILKMTGIIKFPVNESSK